MSVLPELRDAVDAAGLVRELFANPPPAARELAVASDASAFDAVLRYLKVALLDLPPAQAALLRDGAAQLLGERELCGYLIVLLEDAGEAAGRSAADVVSRGSLRGIPPIDGYDGDLHALLLGLCARLGASLPAEALARDVADPRYRDLALFMLAAADLQSLARLLPAVAATLEPNDDYAIEALGRALREALQAHGAEELLASLPAGDAGAVPVIGAAFAEAFTPARVLLLSVAQREQRLETLRRQLRERPEDDYARLSLDAAAREQFLASVRIRLVGAA